MRKRPEVKSSVYGELGEYIARYEHLADAIRLFLRACLKTQGLTKESLVDIFIVELGMNQRSKLLIPVYRACRPSDANGLKALKRAVDAIQKISEDRNKVVHGYLMGEAEFDTLYAIKRRASQKVTGIASLYADTLELAPGVLTKQSVFCSQLFDDFWFARQALHDDAPTIHKCFLSLSKPHLKVPRLSDPFPIMTRLRDRQRSS